MCVQENHQWDNIKAKMVALQGKVSELERAAAQRKTKLDENSAFLQFNWKADVVESWIGTDIYSSLSSLHLLHSSIHPSSILNACFHLALKL